MKRRSMKWVAPALGVFFATTGAFAAGFGIFEQGSKAMGMAGAFTAQADDGSAMFHNVAGLAFQDESSLDMGLTLITFSKSEFDGADPFPGSGVTGEQADQIFYPPHVYWVKPLNSNWTFGFHLNSPFGLKTEWDNVDDWAGRYLSYEAELRVIDLGFNFGWRASDDFGVGFGAIARVSDVALARRIPIVNPFTLRVQDAGDVHLESDFDFGYGLQAGVLHRVTNSFSWGLSYRSKIEIDYGGDGRLTQISTGSPELDFAVAQALPFDMDLPIETSIEFPDQASLGFAFKFSRNTTVEVDVNWTGWSSFDTVLLTFTSAPGLTSELPQDWDDAFNYRLGFAFDRGAGLSWRLGWVYDETPQPDRGVSPLLPDSDRNGFTVGVGLEGGRMDVDLALMYLPFDERETSTNRDNFNGTYNTTAWLFGATLSF